MSEMHITVDTCGFEVSSADVLKAIEAHNENQSAHPGLAIGSGARYEQTFTDANLSIANLLLVSHGLNIVPNSVQVLNGFGIEVFPDAILDLTTMAVTVDLTAFRPLQGNWKIIIGG